VSSYRGSAALGKSFVPAGLHFVAELPKTRSGKVLRRVIQGVATGQDPGDLSTLESLSALDAIRRPL
jgi:acetyl-CoA synthetase